MIRIVLNRIRHRKTAALTLLFALICLFTLIPLGLQHSEEAKSTVDETIEQHGRGSYDILVRPSSSRSDIEKTLGVVEDNYIGDGSGGISIDEWKEMKSDSDIAVAAPVASLGYFRGQQLSVELPVMDEPTRFTQQFFTSDGDDKYAISDAVTYVYFEKTRPGLVQYMKNPQRKELSTLGTAHMNVVMPPTHYLLTAIDVESEEKLTGMDLSDLQKKPDSETEKDVLDNYGNPPVVKVIQRDDLNVPIQLKLQSDTLDVDLEHYLNDLNLEQNEWLMQASSEDKLQNIFNKLQTKQAEETDTTWIDLAPFQNPFNGTALKLDKRLDPSLSEQFTGNVDTSVYYTASTIDYQNLDGTPEVNIVEDGNPPAYKDVEKKGISMKESFDIPFWLEQMGTFTPSSESDNKLAASPLGIYGDMKATAKDGETLTPTTVPGSFIPQPASGLTTLESAQLIKGDEPIDAVRIRVAGITDYDKAARETIENISTDLLKKGYEVDVVAGSSFQNMTLDVEGIGKVSEQWTTLGVAQELRSTWDGVTLMTTGIFLAFALLWLVVRLTFEKNTLATENGILYTLGWRRSKITIRNSLEQYVLITGAFLLSGLILYALEVSAGMYGITAGLWGFAMIAATSLLNKRQKIKTRSRQYQYFAAIRYHKRLILPAMLILLLSTVLISVQLATLGSSYQAASVTSLGEYTNDLTFWLQMSVMVSTFVLAIISVTECINTLLDERKSEFEMYHVIGWRQTRVVFHLLKETAVWTGLPLACGVILGSLALIFLQVPFIWMLIGLGVSIGLSIIAVMTIVLTRRLTRTN